MFNPTFKMLPGEEGPGYRISITSDSAKWSITDIWQYEYLANPEATRVAANSSIKRSV